QAARYSSVGARRDIGSRSSGPASTWSSSAASRTVRAIGPMTEPPQKSVVGKRGTSPLVVFRPKTPHQDAGVRIEPPPSEPCAIGPSPLATAAAAPPDEPPQVRSSFQGFRPGGAIRLSDENLWPKCGVVVLPSRQPPIARSRPTATLSSVGTCCSNH